ncbi:leukotriene B4 receptor 1-like [Engraulis encrasicolus]|uniref:leukotriene B4 receptor 1-like n=1 Tax=Engraulis encrasicolus TaxID=184585 RepID=UPI002FD47140
MSKAAIDVLAGVLMGVCCLVGIPGNVWVVVVVARRYQPDNFSLKLMLSLAVADLLSLLLLPMELYNLMAAWALGEVACRLLFFLLYWGLHASVFSVAMLSIQRYLQVLHTHCWTRLQGSGQQALLVSMWAMAACISSPCLVVRGVHNSTCTSRYQDDVEEAMVLVCQTLFGFVIPFAAIVSLYTCLQRRVTQMVVLRTRRTTRLVTYIVVTFSIFWTPMHLFNVLALGAMAFRSLELENVCNKSWPFLMALCLVNACLNPFLYAFAHKQLHTTPNTLQPSIHRPMAIPIPR